jgi:type I phosphodiesterase/nucleotide pyrophosphatase
VRGALVLLALVVASLQPPLSDRVFMLSLDGMGYQRLTEDPVVAELPTLTALLKTGAHAEGLRPAFPASTANSHAALWTGTYAGQNGILYNSTPPLPRSGHTYSERVSGYRSESLTAEPIWLAAARQGVTVVAHQVTQIVPFLPQTIGDRPLPGLVAVNGFQSKTFAPWRTVRTTDADVHTIPCAQLPARIRGATRCVEWTLGREAGDRRLRAAVFGDRLVIADAASETTIEVERRATETTPPKGRALARHWSTPLRLADPPDATAVSLTFRLFELDAAGGTFLLVQSPFDRTGRVDRRCGSRCGDRTGPARYGGTAHCGGNAGRGQDLLDPRGNA